LVAEGARRAEATDGFGQCLPLRNEESLHEESLKLARALARGPTEAFGHVKRLLATSTESSLETQLGYESSAITMAAATADGREDVAAFVAKRSPIFYGQFTMQA
jgi:2-(1,2-epoxy-1,2-dihydrophenyl)acetyl-CoA isomerase